MNLTTLLWSSSIPRGIMILGINFTGDLISELPL
jgi:hypothetical protein